MSDDLMFLLDDMIRWLKGSQEGSEVIGSPILNVIPFPLLICDKDLSILNINTAFRRHFKVDQDPPEKTVLQILGMDVKVIEERDGWPIKERQVSDLGSLMEGDNPKILEGNFPKIGHQTFNLYTRKIHPYVLL